MVIHFKSNRHNSDTRVSIRVAAASATQMDKQINRSRNFYIIFDISNTQHTHTNLFDSIGKQLNFDGFDSRPQPHSKHHHDQIIYDPVVNSYTLLRERFISFVFCVDRRDTTKIF